MAQAYTSMMKFTVDGRPYTKDVHDLFGALVTQIKFKTHRYLFRNYETTFNSDDAIKVLGSLQFSRSVRVPDVHDSSKMVTTVTTTTFNMECGVAKALCQQFLGSCLMFNAVDPSSRSFRDRGLWQISLKGWAVLFNFCQQSHMYDHPILQQIDNDRLFKLVTLERTDDDQLVLNRQKMAPLFRTVVNGLLDDASNSNKSDSKRGGLSVATQHGMAASVDSSSNSKKYNDRFVNPSSSSSSSSSNSRNTRSLRGLSSKRNSISSFHSGFSSSTDSNSTPTGDLSTGSTTTSVSAAASTSIHARFLDRYLFLDSKILQSVRQYQHQRQSASSTNASSKPSFVFSSQQYCEWLLSFCTIATRDEAEAITTEFLRHGWIEYQNENHQLEHPTIESSKETLVVVTSKGRNNLELGTAKLHYSESQHKQGRVVSSYEPITIPPLPTTTSKTPTPTATPSPLISSAPMEALTSTIYHYHQQQQQSSDGGCSARLMIILKDAQLRSLFTDFLRANFCSENLDFWIDYTNLRRKCKHQNPGMLSQNQMELLEDVYMIWSTYLSPGARCELNVDHTLQKEISRLVPSMIDRVVPGRSYAPACSSSRMVVNISSQSNSQCLHALLKRFDRVEAQICRLMSNDSVPKFVVWLQNYQQKQMVPGLENGIQMLKI